MTSKEFVDKILESNSTDWFKTIEVNFNLQSISFYKKFHGLSEFHKYLSTQVRGYEKIENLPPELNHSKTFFKKNLNNIEGFLTRYNRHNENQLNQSWRSVTTQNNTHKITLNDNKVLPYNSEYVSNLIEINQLDTSFTRGAFNFYTKVPIGNTKNDFTGGLLAYEFENPKSILSKRNYSADKKIQELNSRVEELLSQNERHLIDSLEKSKIDYQEYLGKIDEFKTNKESVFNDWFEGNEENEILGVKKEFNNFKENKELIFNNWFEGTEGILGAKEKVSDLEHTYEELLRLKKPAEYWKTRATELKKEGRKAIYLLIGLVAFACVTLYLLLWLTPEGMLLSFVKGNAQAIKWSVVYITFISFLAFGIRAVNKVAFSLFHLARDAEEREQLTYVYLALIKDNAVEEKDKNLILQSLFSRADTGLLKDDSGPTMPNNIAGKIFGGN